MSEIQQRVQGIEAVREFVNQTLCSRDNLQIGCFTLSERPLIRGERVCGFHFCLHGPRLMMLTAIWDLETNSVLFYGSQGERFQTAHIPTDHDLGAVQGGSEQVE